MVDILVVGGSGFIGARAAQSALKAGYSVACTVLTRPAPAGVLSCSLNIHDRPALVACLERFRPRAVIYCALSWDLSNSSAQMRISAGGVKELITAMYDVGLHARLVYVSTNAVFSGQHGPYLETDRPDPENRIDAYRFYGSARRAGEVIALNEWSDTIIARTANVDGRDAWGNINKRLVSLIEPLRAGRSLPRYVDRFISPTLVDNLADALFEVALPEFQCPPGGIVHLAGSEIVSDYQYAQRLAGLLGSDPALVREDRYLPPESAGNYNIALDIANTQSLLKTRFLNVGEILKSILD